MRSEIYNNIYNQHEQLITEITIFIMIAQH